MSMSGILKTVAVALALSALPTVGGAQTGPSASREPIMWGADTLEVTGGDTLTLKGRAELVQGDNRFRANQIAGFNQSGDSQLEATGDVYFVTPEQTIRGDRATYNTASGVIVLTGDVILTQGENVMTGSRLTYNTRTRSAQMQGGGQNGRVQGVFYPESSGN